MKLSERLREQTDATPERSALDFSTPRSAAEPVAVDAVTEMKTRAHEALFARLGLRLFDSTLSQDQLHAYVAQEIGDLMASATALRCRPASGSGSSRRSSTTSSASVPIERFLDDPTVTEVMVNATDADLRRAPAA